MKIRVISEFYDKFHTSTLYKVGTVVDFDDERAKDIISKKLAEPYAAPEKAAEPAPAKAEETVVENVAEEAAKAAEEAAEPAAEQTANAEEHRGPGRPKTKDKEKAE